MGDTELTIIIPARNEPGLPDTIKSLYKHSKGLFEVLVVNDCSDKWTPLQKRKGMRVIDMYPPAGFGGSIQAGIDEAQSENIYICGARTRFTAGWMERTIAHINDEPETLFSVTNPVITGDDTEISQATSTTYGAELFYFKQKHWFKYLINYPIRKKPKGDEIQCAYGGSYALKKSWWTHIHGLNMIDTRGGCNQFLSLKTIIAGGKLKVMKDVVVGNIYRELL